MAVHIGLLLIRAIVGLTMAGHAAQKLFGWFDGSGVQLTADAFEDMGYRPGKVMAILAGLGEAGGVLVVLGLLTPVGAAAGIGVKLNDILGVHLPNGFWNRKDGFEYPLTVTLVLAGISFTGPGRFSVDATLGWHQSGPIWGILAMGAGVAATIGVLVMRALAHRAAEDPTWVRRYFSRPRPGGEDPGVMTVRH